MNLPPRPPKPARPYRVLNFYEQVWPLNVTLLIVASFLVGAVAARSDFHDKRIFYNGWLHLIVLAICFAGATWVINWRAGHSTRRSILATITSAVWHAAMLVGLYFYSEGEPEMRPRFLLASHDKYTASMESAPDDVEMDALDDTALPTEETDAPSPGDKLAIEPTPLDEPVEMSAPPVTNEPKLAREVRTPTARTQTPEVAAEPEIEGSRSVAPTDTSRREVAQAPPRRADRPSKLSRRTTDAPTPEPAVADTAEAAPGATTAPAPVDATAKTAQRQAGGGSGGPVSPNASDAPAVVSQQATQIARRESTDAPPRDSSRSQAVRRSVATPAAGAPAQIESPDAVASAGPNVQAGGAAQVGVTRQSAATPALAQQSADASAVASKGPSAGPGAARTASADQPQVKTPAASQLARAGRPSAVAGAPEAAADGPPAPGSGQGGGESATPGPARTALAGKASSSSPGPITADSGGGPQVGVGSNPSGSAGAPGLRRAESGQTPTINPSAVASRRPSRATQVAQIESSPTNIDSPGVGPSSGTGAGGGAAGAGELQAGQTSLARGSAGSSGLGTGQPLGHGSGVSQTTTPSVGVTAARPSQLRGAAGGGAGAAGPGLPGALARSVGRSSATGKFSGTPLDAEDVSPNPGTGADQAGGLAGGGAGNGGGGTPGAQGGLAIQRSAAGSPLASGPPGGGLGSGDALAGGGASGGAGNIGRAGGGRASGSDGAGSGGPGSAARGRLARSALGSGGQGTLAAADIKDVPTAPAGDGGGAPGADPAAAGGGGGGGGTALRRATASTGDIAPGGLASAGGGPGDAAAGGGGAAGGVAGGIGAGGGPRVGSAGMARAGGEGTGGEGNTPGAGIAGSGKSRLGRTSGGAVAIDGSADAMEAGGGGTGNTPGGGLAGSGGATEEGALRPSSGPTGRGSAGLPGTGAVAANTLGGSDDATIVSGNTGAPGLGVASRRESQAGEPNGSAVAVGGAGPARRRNIAGVPGGVDAVAVDEPGLGAGGTEGTGTGSGPGTGSGVGPGVGNAADTVAGEISRRSGGGLPVQVAALEGPGGLGGAEVSAEVGSLSRRAQRDSDVIHGGTARFLSRKVGGGPLPVEGHARDGSNAFSGRIGRRGNGDGEGDGFVRPERTVELGLAFLARHQASDGRWSLHRFGAGRPGYEREQATFQSDTAATGMSLLAFLGAGYDHFEGPYQRVVSGGLQHLLAKQKPNGDLYDPGDAESNQSAWLYSHGIATIALCEAYGMTGDEALRGPAQKAIDFIVAAQNPSTGAWRYQPQSSGDTSVSGWQLMALKSGELAGLSVPSSTYEGVKRWLDGAQASPTDGSQYVYNPAAPDTEEKRHGRRPSPAMSAVGLLMRLYTGSNRTDPQMIKGAEHLLTKLPAMGVQSQPTRDTYYWYYATQIMFHMKGDFWKQWNDKLHPLLVKSQVQSGPMAGSWDPALPVPDRWGPQGGRLYVTTLNLLSLEVYYRHLPIYDSEAK